jgi:GTP-binding protein
MKVAILGRPNVGKSTLFNRLVGKKIAIVEDTPGVTRDWQLRSARIGDLKFELIDTAGLIGFEDQDIVDKIEKQNQKVIQQADVILFMVDGREGLISSDIDLARQLQQESKRVIAIANKCENVTSISHLAEFYKLGLGEPVAISAAHGLGLDELYIALKDSAKDVDEKEELTEQEFERPLQLAIVGRPNVGKSTLINALLKEERVLTGHKPGITRDTIAVPWDYKGHAINLIDTAGMRKRSKIDENLETLSIKEALVAIRFAEVVILVLDAQAPLEKQDLHIASHVIEEGRALVIALNKLDLAKGDIVQEAREKLKSVLPQVKDIPCIAVSAIQQKNLDRLMSAVFQIEQLWNTRVSTAGLNRWLMEATERHPTPLVGANRVRIKYATQIKTRPPTFALFISKPADLPDSYLKYLMNDLRTTFKLPGVPIRFLIKKGKNPYQPSDKHTKRPPIKRRNAQSR